MSTFNKWLRTQTCWAGVILAVLPPCCTFRAEPSGGGGTSARTKAWWVDLLGDRKQQRRQTSRLGVSAATRRPWQLEETWERMILCLTSDTKVRRDVYRFNCKTFHLKPLVWNQKRKFVSIQCFVLFFCQSWQFQPDTNVSPLRPCPNYPEILFSSKFLF